MYGNSSSGVGAAGESSSNAGVYGHSSTSYGVYGHSNTSCAGYFNGNVYVTGTLTQNSDARLKQGISDLNYGLREVMQLRPATWTWKEKPEHGVQLGLITQDVETVLPELVSKQSSNNRRRSKTSRNASPSSRSKTGNWRSGLRHWRRLCPLRVRLQPRSNRPASS